ncbi:helix-turn-helix domain-containing protein, partial [Thomasclavelia cocleata]
NQPVSTNTLDRLCNILECDISDIMEHIPDNNFF